MPRGDGPLYDFDELAAQFPSLKRLAAPESRECEQAWVEALEEKDLVPDILRDVIKFVYHKRGHHGARRTPQESEVDMGDILGTDISDQPFHVAVPQLMRAQHVTTRSLAMRANLNRRTLQRMMLDEDDPAKHAPNIGDITAIGEVLRKRPSYFREYREIMVLAAYQRLIVENPEIATSLYRTYLQAKNNEVFYDRKQSPFLLPERLTARDIARHAAAEASD